MKQSSTWWRTLLAGIFTVLGAAALMGALLTRYIQHALFTTDGYLSIVEPLPQNPQVAAALAHYATDQLFDTTNAQSALKDFLPPKLAPLASPLTNALQKKVNHQAKNFVQSDTFSSIWIAGNTAAQKSFVRLAQSKEGQGRGAAFGSLNLSGLVEKMRARFGDDRVVLTSQQKDHLAQVRINLHQRVDRLRTTYQAINSGAYALPYAGGALLLAALAVASSRRRAVITIGVVLLVVCFGVLIFFKTASGNLMGEIANPTYHAAAQAVYESFYGSLRTKLVAVMIAGVILIALAIMTGPYSWAAWVRTKVGLARLEQSKAHNTARLIRRTIRKYEAWLLLIGLVIVMIWLLALSALTPATAVVIISLLVGYSSIVHLAARLSLA